MPLSTVQSVTSRRLLQSHFSKAQLLKCSVELEVLATRAEPT